MAAIKRRQDEKHLKILRELGTIPQNKQCFDCNQRGPTYVDMTIGSFVCTSCSGVLRGLNPPHRVKSISMASFSPDEIEFIKCRGNEYCRREWMGTYDGQPPVESDSKDEQRIKDFMAMKYERKRWYVDPAVAQRNQPLQSQQLSSPPPVPDSRPLAFVGNNVKAGGTVQNSQMHVSRPIMQSASFPPATAARPSMDLLGELGSDPFASSTSHNAMTNNANASFANFDNFSAVRLQAEATTLQSSLPKPPTSPPSPTPNRRSRPISSLHSQNSSKLPPTISSSNFSRDDSAANNNTTASEAWSSFFAGPSSPPTFATHSGPTNTSSTNAFGAPPSSNPSSAFVPRSTSSPPSSGQPTSKDRYAALADLDSLFHSSTVVAASPPTAPVDWEGKGSAAAGTPWTVNGASPPSIFSSGGPTQQSAYSTASSSNPFASTNSTPSTWNQQPTATLAPMQGNPFASGFNYVPNNAPRAISPSEPFSTYPNSGMVMSGYPGVVPNNANVVWGTAPAPYAAPPPTNGNYPGYKMTSPFGAWQPSAGNPFMAGVNAAAPQKSASSNPFL